MRLALLAGALLGAAAASLLAPGFAGNGLLRERLLLGLGSALLLTAVLALLLGLLPPRFRPRRGGALLFGLALALAPAAGAWLPKETFGLLLPLAALGAWRREPPALPAPVAGASVLAAVLGLAVLALRPTSLAVEAPGTPLVAGGQGPDVVLVSIDTLRADALTGPRELMPRLRALAAEGTWAEYALSPSSQTVPAHYTMFTGLNVLGHGVYNNQQSLGQDPVLAERFLEGGWRTAAVVSSAPMRGANGFARGFQVYHEAPIARFGPVESLYRWARKNTWAGWLGLASPLADPVQRLLTGRVQTPWDGNQGNGRHTTDDALEMLRRLRQAPSPFFLFVHYMDPHAPYCPPPGYAGTWARPDPVAEEYRRKGGEVPDGDWRLANRLGEAKRRGENVEAGIAHLRDLYDEECRFTDAMLGELFDALRDSERETVLLVTSDHGEHFGEHGLMTHANSLYEPLLRVPFVLHGPGIPARRLPSPPHLEDVKPTLLAAAGLLPAGGPAALDPPLTGRILGAATVEERPVHFAAQKTLPQHSGETPWERILCVREGPWKLICAFDLEAEPPVVEAVELYHLERDPAESRNLLEAETDLVRRLEGLAAGLARNARKDASEQRSEEFLEMLDQLGY